MSDNVMSARVTPDIYSLMSTTQATYHRQPRFHDRRISDAFYMHLNHNHAMQSTSVDTLAALVFGETF